MAASERTTRSLAYTNAGNEVEHARDFLEQARDQFLKALALTRQTAQRLGLEEADGAAMSIDTIEGINTLIQEMTSLADIFHDTAKEIGRA